MTKWWSIFVLLTLNLVAESPALMPMPQQAEWGEGVASIQTVRLRVPRIEGEESRRLRFAMGELQNILKENRIRSGNRGYTIAFEQGEVEVPSEYIYGQKEAYKMSITRNGTKVTAPNVSGMYYAVQTLRQLIQRTKRGAVLPIGEIVDYPAFKIRGFMHDTGRNFQSIGLLKDQIEVMARYKLNVFHWHFTEYHGWRLESKIFPQLQKPEAFSRKAGKYYTQQEFKDMVDFCWLRHITIIPEFDSPGHSDAFKKGMGFKTMREPKVIPTLVALINELCTLAPKEIMPYVHLGTDEVRAAADKVGPEYLPALNKAVRDNGREVIGWWHGMHVPGDDKQIQQTWAKFNPRSGNRHIDSRSNYINHTCAFDVLQRLLFQQPCRVPYGDKTHLGGVLCYWPDTKVDDENLSITNSPVYLSIVGYSEAVWTGRKKDYPKYWAQIPQPGTEEYQMYQDYERRVLAQRRLLKNRPMKVVAHSHIPWKLIGPFKSSQIKEAETPEKVIKESYSVGGKTYKWWNELAYGGAVHVKHFFGFPAAGSSQSFGSGEDIVYAVNYLYSPKDQVVPFWINFNTTSTSDQRGGCTRLGYWNDNKNCNIWVNGQAVEPPKWKNPENIGKEVALVDDIYTSREPTPVKLKRGWNTFVLRTSPKWKWSFTCVPVMPMGPQVLEVPGLKWSVKPE